MDKINFFPDSLNVQNQKIILRLDLNVPLKNKIITDDTRITLCLPFLKKLISKKAKIIIFHGKPNPPEAIEGKSGKWYRRVLPTPWVAEHWR